MPIYAPVGYYPPPLEDVRPNSGRSSAGSRSASSSSRREDTAEHEAGYPPYPARFYGPSSVPAYDDGSLGSARNRSASSAQYGTDFYGMPAVPGAQGRRNVSGPADMQHPKAPRAQARSPLATQQSTNVAQQWPPQTDSRPGASPSASSSSSDDGDEGVRVEILPEANGNGYTINRRPVPSSGNGREVKRRKGRK